MEEDQEHTYRVVRFEVIPQSIRLEGEWGGVTRGAGLVDGPRLLLLGFLTLGSYEVGGLAEIKQQLGACLGLIRTSQLPLG